MRKTCFLTLLFLCMNCSIISNADTGSLRWCGKYIEENNQGYLVVTKNEIVVGSKSCDIDRYTSQLKEVGAIHIALDFTKNRSALGNWRKFNNHVIEVRGKIRNNKITNTRLVRDMGL